MGVVVLNHEQARVIVRRVHVRSCQLTVCVCVSCCLRIVSTSVHIDINFAMSIIPGFELGIKSMKPGGKRRIVVPPELGPPVGPATFFSAKQYEVFDVELRAVKTCRCDDRGVV